MPKWTNDEPLRESTTSFSCLPSLHLNTNLHANPATPLPSEVQAASAQSNYNIITIYLRKYPKATPGNQFQKSDAKSESRDEATKILPKPKAKLNSNHQIHQAQKNDKKDEESNCDYKMPHEFWSMLATARKNISLSVLKRLHRRWAPAWPPKLKFA